MYVRFEFESQETKANSDIGSSPNGTCTASTGAFCLGYTDLLYFFYLDDEVVAKNYKGEPLSLKGRLGIKHVDILPIQGNPRNIVGVEAFEAHRKKVVELFTEVHREELSSGVELVTWPKTFKQ